MQQWFQEQDECPTGCGCFCTDYLTTEDGLQEAIAEAIPERAQSEAKRNADQPSMSQDGAGLLGDESIVYQYAVPVGELPEMAGMPSISSATMA